MARFKPMELIDKMSGKNQEPGSLLQKKRPSSAFFCIYAFFFVPLSPILPNWVKRQKIIIIQT